MVFYFTADSAGVDSVPFVTYLTVDKIILSVSYYLKCDMVDTAIIIDIQAMQKANYRPETDGLFVSSLSVNTVLGDISYLCLRLEGIRA